MGNPVTSKRKLITIFRPFIAGWMRKVTNYRVISAPPDNAIRPYLFISNHVSIYDLVLILLQLKKMPVIVIHEVFQLNPVVAWLLRPFGLIWKQSGLHDAKSIRQMKRAAAAGRSLLLYPEGDLCWDGETGVLPDEIVRLIRYVGLPVAVLRQQGAYLTYPRWGGGVRKGRVDLSFGVPVGEADLHTLTDGEMLERLQASFQHSERDWSRLGAGKGLDFVSTKPASGISKMLFMCPSCKAAGSMKASGTQVSCAKCGYIADVDGRLEISDSGRSGFSDAFQWHSWQDKEWKARVADEAVRGAFNLQESLKKADFLPAAAGADGIAKGGGFHSRRLRRQILPGAETIEITSDGLSVYGNNREQLLNIPLRAMKTARVLPMHIYKPNWLLIGTEEGYYRFMFRDGVHPAYPWCMAIGVMAGSWMER